MTIPILTRPSSTPGYGGILAADLPAATTSVQGALSATDKTKLDGIAAGASVSAVALAMPAEFGVSGSPVATSGTIVVGKTNQSANQVYAGPASGGLAAPSFRGLVPADIPGFRRAAIAANNVPQSFNSGSEDQVLMATVADQDSIGGQTSSVFGVFTGNAAKTNGSNQLIGTGTIFLSQATIGRVVMVPGGAFTERRTVVAVADDTHLTVNSPFTTTASGQIITDPGSTLVCREAGLYLVGGYFPWASNSTGLRGAFIYVNDYNFVVTNEKTAITVFPNHHWMVSEPVNLSVWDRLTMTAYQGSGAPLSSSASNLNFCPRLSMTYLGRRA